MSLSYEQWRSQIANRKGAKGVQKPLDKAIADAAALKWEGVEYPRVAASNYQAICVGWQGPELIKRFRRWSLRLEFSLMDEGTLVSAFYGFGNGPSPRVQGQRSRYYRAWSLANGEPPRKGQSLSFETFREPGLIYLVSVKDSGNDEEGSAKDDVLVYSFVSDILKVTRK